MRQRRGRQTRETRTTESKYLPALIGARQADPDASGSHRALSHFPRCNAYVQNRVRTSEMENRTEVSALRPKQRFKRP